GLLVVFFLEWLALDIIRSAGDIERVIDVAVLGAIPSNADSGSSSLGEKRRQLIPRRRLATGD
ncbi:MAG TPA: hypothetical protein PKE64_16430, partial [Anaerolineae bacterium]|nr:hypothetical protein [Anaerolineae bacterium]